jgi:hypothetical protein
MVEQIVVFLLVGLFGLYSAAGILIWGFAVTMDFLAYSHKAVDFLSIASSARRTLFTGAITTLSSACTLAIWWVYLLSMHHPDFQWLLISLVCLLCLFVILWSATLYVGFLTRRQPYLYHLPQDADDLRLRNCQQGIMTAATLYPKVITDEDTVDTISRASSVSMRYELFPKLKQRKGLKTMKLTNDFAVYCNVCAEGYTRGYYGILAAIQKAPDHLEAQCAILQAWPETAESRQLMDTLVAQFLK